jgi:hypothetical protein
MSPAWRGSLAAAVFLALQLVSRACHAQPPQHVRFWIDRLYFSPSDSFFLQTEVAKAPDKLANAGVDSGAYLSTRGADEPGAWDVYITNRRQCYMATAAAQVGEVWAQPA